MKGLTPRGRTLVTVGAVLVLLFALTQLLQNRQADTTVRPQATASATASARITTTASASTTTTSGLPPCTGSPPEVADAVAAVRANGPYLRPRDDGGVFGNRERLLPQRRSGYYREYTVEAPGERFPGPRRLITGGQSRLGAEPEVWYYTADHYESFCELVGV